MATSCLFLYGGSREDYYRNTEQTLPYDLSNFDVECARHSSLHLERWKDIDWMPGKGSRVGLRLSFFSFSRPPASFTQPLKKKKTLSSLKKQLYHLFPAGRLREPRVRERARQEHAQHPAQGEEERERAKKGGETERAGARGRSHFFPIHPTSHFPRARPPTPAHSDPHRQAPVWHRLLGGRLCPGVRGLGGGRPVWEHGVGPGGARRLLARRLGRLV